MIRSEAETLFLTRLRDIERIIVSLCRRAGLSSADAEDFGSMVKLHLIEDDYSVLRKFEGRSSFNTFMGIVVGRMLMDYRNREWGRWHPSAEAQRLGELAMEIERLLVRDQRTIDDVLVAMKSRAPGITGEEIERVAARLPKRHRRKMVDLEEAEDVLQVTPHDFIPERRRTAEHVSEVVGAFLDHLSDEDRLIFQLHFLSDMSIAQVARMINVPQKPLYRRLEQLSVELRKSLKADGVEAADVLELLRRDPGLLDFRWKSRDADQETS